MTGAFDRNYNNNSHHTIPRPPLLWVVAPARDYLRETEFRGVRSQTGVWERGKNEIRKLPPASPSDFEFRF